MTFSVLSKVSLDRKQDEQRKMYIQLNIKTETWQESLLSDLKNTVNHSFTFYKLGSPYNAIHGNLKCNFNKHF